MTQGPPTGPPRLRDHVGRVDGIILEREYMTKPNKKIQNEMKAMWAWFCAQKIPEWMGGDYKDMAAIQYDQIAW